MKETLSSKNKNTDRSQNIESGSIKNIFTKNNLSFVQQKVDENSDFPGKSKIDYLQMNKIAVKNKNCRT